CEKSPAATPLPNHASDDIRCQASSRIVRPFSPSLKSNWFCGIAAITFLVVSDSRSIPSSNMFAMDLASAGFMRTPPVAYSTTFQFFLRMTLSKLQGPGPAVESHKKLKHYNTVISPPLSSGQKLRGAWVRSEER